MTNRGKASNNRQTNNNNNKTQNDDDNCSVICYKDSDDGHVGVVRIRQQLTCSACNAMRGTLSLYYKHILENNHRENVKKLCDENRFVPSVFDQAIHLAFQNNFYYQSDKFHFLYKHTNEEADTSLQQTESTVTNNESSSEKMEVNNNQQKTATITPTNTRKRRRLQVILVFQDKTYSRIGTANAYIREQLLKEMLTDRADDISALPMEIYYIKKKIAPDDIHYNAQKSSVILTMVKDQSQIMLKNQQQQEPFNNGMSPAKTSSEDNGVEQNTAMTTHEISTADNIDDNEQPSFVDDVMNVCKDVLNNITVDIYSKCGELKREQQFLSGIARRSFKKKNTFFCDICSIFLTSEKYCIQHLNGSDHLDKVRLYQTTFLPWRQAMQKSLIAGKSIKEIMGASVYDEYKTTMALYLAPNSLSNRGRFCCAYCELVFTDQWALEKHLHTTDHQNKKSSSNETDYKELVVRFANIVILPTIFKFNGITQLSEIPDDIKNRYQWRCVTRIQLNDDTTAFSRNYPFDAFEGVTHIVNAKSGRKHQKSSAAKSVAQNLRNNTNGIARNQQGRRGGFHHTRGGQFPPSTAHRGAAIKRPFPITAPTNKRFRGDLNNSFPGANHRQGPVRNYEMDQYNYGRPIPYNNGNDRWPSRPSFDQQQAPQRQEFIERPNFESRSLASDNNVFFAGRPAMNNMNRGNNYGHEQSARFNSGGNGRYDNQPANYDTNFLRAVAQAVSEYHPESNPPLLVGPPHRANTGPTNELIHHVANSLQRPQPPLPPPQQQQQQQQQQSSMGQVRHQNQNPFGAFGVNNNTNNNQNNTNNNTNSSFFSSAGNQQQNQMWNNNPPIRSYADYRASSGPSTGTAHSSMYPPLSNPQNPVAQQTRTFDEFNLAPLAQNSYGQSSAPSFGSEETRYGNFGRPNQAEQAPWRGSPRGANNNRGRGGHAQSMNKQAGSTFSFSSSNNSPMRGRGAGRNARNFGSRR